jgi:hypothetical protein
MASPGIEESFDSTKNGDTEYISCLTKLAADRRFPTGGELEGYLFTCYTNLRSGCCRVSSKHRPCGKGPSLGDPNSSSGSGSHHVCCPSQCHCLSPDICSPVVKSSQHSVAPRWGPTGGGPVGCRVRHGPAVFAVPGPGCAGGDAEAPVGARHRTKSAASCASISRPGSSRGRRTTTGMAA